jgi:hypothetical protein
MEITRLQEIREDEENDEDAPEMDTATEPSTPKRPTQPREPNAPSGKAPHWSQISAPSTPLRPIRPREPNAPSGKAPHWTELAQVEKSVEQQTWELYEDTPYQDPARELFPRNHTTPVRPTQQASTNAPARGETSMYVTPVRPTQPASTDAPARGANILELLEERVANCKQAFTAVDEKRIKELARMQEEQLKMPYPSCVLPPLPTEELKLIYAEYKEASIRLKAAVEAFSAANIYPTAQLPPLRLPEPKQPKRKAPTESPAAKRKAFSAAASSDNDLQYGLPWGSQTYVVSHTNPADGDSLGAYTSLVQAISGPPISGPAVSGNGIARPVAVRYLTPRMWADTGYSFNTSTGEPTHKQHQ